MQKDKIVLIGAGLAGSLLSIYLAKKGFNVEIYERRPDMRKVKISAGRSINLALSTRGIYALQEVGLADEILKLAIPMKGRMIHSIKGELTFQSYGKDETEVINSISRAGLNVALMNLAEEYDNVRIQFNQRCTGMNFETGEVELHNENTGEIKKIASDIVIGTDGSASAIRVDMLKIGGFNFNFSQNYEEHGYKELTIPPGPNGTFLIEKNALHIWPRGTYMLIALPNLDGNFTCTLFLPFKGENSFENLDTKNKVVDFFKKQFPDAVPLVPDLTEDFFKNPTGNLVTVKCFPWHFKDKVLLLGDSAHAIVPFFGQGMNCAFEDCIYLNECIEKYGTDWEKIFIEFEELRKINADAIAELALENFVEMRDHTANPKFLLRKKAEILLEKKYPDFISKYAMVTFHREIPYSIAMTKGQLQDKILDELCKSIDKIEDLDLERAYTLIKNEHSKLNLS
jgi:kynurenine 3-monooxygenase